jgi:hypothetical protein
MKLLQHRSKLWLIPIVFIFVLFFGAVLGAYLYYVDPPLKEAIYKHDIDKAYEAFYPEEVTNLLSDMGVTLKPYAHDKAYCDNGPYSVSSPCSRYLRSESMTVTPEFKQQWYKNSGHLEEYLANHGWQPAKHNEASSLSNIFESPDGKQVSADYVKSQNGVDCTIGADYYRSSTINSVSVGMGCTRDPDGY